MTAGAFVVALERCELFLGLSVASSLLAVVARARGQPCPLATVLGRTVDRASRVALLWVLSHLDPRHRARWAATAALDLASHWLVDAAR
jgi:hypothetical protein